MDLSRLPAPLRQKLEARLATLPVQYREVLATRLAKLPPAQLEQMLAKSSPMLDRLIDKIGGLGTGSNTGTGTGSSSGGSSQRGASAGANSAGPDSDVARPAGAGFVVGGPTRRINAALIPGAKTHYNTTVQRGDSPMPTMGALLIVLLGLAAIAWNLGWLEF